MRKLARFVWIVGACGGLLVGTQQLAVAAERDEIDLCRPDFYPWDYDCY